MRLAPLAGFGLLFASLAIAADPPEAADPPAKPGDRRPAVGLDVEVERLGELDRLTVYIHNDRAEPFEFENGAAGGAGSLDDRDRHVAGTAPTVLPLLTFYVEGAEVGTRSATLSPPMFHGLTRRSMRPHKVSVPPRGRLRYASWLVPHEYATGRLGMASMKLADDDAPAVRERLLWGDTLTEVEPPAAAE